MVSWLNFHVVYFIQVHLPRVSSPLVNLFNISSDMPAFMMIWCVIYIIHEGKKGKLLSNQT